MLRDQYFFFNAYRLGWSKTHKHLLWHLLLDVGFVRSSLVRLTAIIQEKTGVTYGFTLARSYLRMYLTHLYLEEKNRLEVTVLANTALKTLKSLTKGTAHVQPRGEVPYLPSASWRLISPPSDSRYSTHSTFLQPVKVIMLHCALPLTWLPQPFYNMACAALSRYPAQVKVYQTETLSYTKAAFGRSVWQSCCYWRTLLYVLLNL